MADLDKSQPYFHVHGDVGGAAFEQGGKLFDSQGKQLGVTLTAEADEAGGKGKAKGKRANAKSDPVETAGEAVEATGAATAVDAQLAAQGAE